MNEKKQYNKDDFANWLHSLLAESKDTGTIDVVPAMCGIGKSYSLTVQIAKALEKDKNVGLLLVTDECERMKNYVDRNDNSYLSNYIRRNRDRILIYEASNAKDDFNLLFNTQIVLMTTQRFFSLSREKVIQLTQTYIPKRNVIIDERAPISETIKVDITTFNDVDNAINTRLHNKNRDKDWLNTQWQNLRMRYYEIIKRYEASHNGTELCLWHVDDDKNIATDTERFKHLVFETYPESLRKGDYDPKNKCRKGDCRNTLKKIQAIIQIVENGALFISRKKRKANDNNEYSNFFMVTLDHSDLLLDIGCKVVVLDGSGGIDPIYSAWYVNQIDCKLFNRDLSNLTINIVNINTSRSAIDKDPENNKKLKAIIDYVKTIPKVDVVFTYGYGKENELEENDTVERQFQKADFLTGHLGGLKGKNKFRELTDIVQVGLNRIGDEYYLAQAMANVANRYPPSVKACCLVNYEKAKISVMLHSLLADVEQNIFRGVIRNIDNTQMETYTLIYSAKPYTDEHGNNNNPLSGLTDMIVERYTAMGATVNVFDTPCFIRGRKAERRQTQDGKKTNVQKVMEYLDRVEKIPNFSFKPKDIRDTCKITVNTWKYIKRIDHIAERLKLMKTDIDGLYRVPAL